VMRIAFLCVLPLCVVLPARDAFALERAALTLSGANCSLSPQTMIQALEQLDGIVRVQTNMIPNHLLVDHDGLHRTAEELADFLNQQTVANHGCRATVMRSCITATFSASKR
jgi:hypothetical protein